RDDKDSGTCYYVVVQPSILKNGEEPSLTGYAILPESGAVGATESVVDAGLSLEVGLKPAPGSLEKAREMIAKEWQREVRRLVPAPIAEGKVYLMLANAGEDPDPEDWYITTGVCPSIFGDNRAALVVNTDGENGKRLIAAMNEDVVAGTLLYDLRLLGISPTFRARMRVHWERVYQHFEKHETTNYVFRTDQISNSIDSLRETSAIEVEIEELDPDVRSFATKSLFNELKTQVIERLFKPAVPPLSAAKKWEDRLISGLTRVASSVIPGLHHQLIRVKEQQWSTTTIDLQEKGVKKYPFYPQALLSTMIRQAGGMAGRLHWIKVDDLDFRSDVVDVVMAADTFNTSNIKSVKMDCRVYDIELDKVVKEMTLVFDNADQLKSSFNYIRQKGNTYRYEYRAVIFLESSDEQVLPTQLEIDWQYTNSSFIYFNAAEYFENYDFTIGVDDLDIFNYAHLIEVRADFFEKQPEEEEEEKAEKIPIIGRTFLFSLDDKEKKVLSFLTARDMPLRMDLEVTYYLASSKEHKVKYTDLKDDFFFLPNPFENKWNVDLISAVNWAETLKVITEVRVWDEVRKSYIMDKFRFTKDHEIATFNCVSSLETQREALEVRFNIIKMDASVLRSDWLEHRGSVLVVKDDVKPERTIRATLVAAPDFEDKEVKKATIEFQYKDEKNQIDLTSDKLEWESIGETVRFTHPMPDFTALSYSYRVRATSYNGDSYRSDWKQGVESTLDVVIPEEVW
ncbi:MAG: hypothetical protein KDD15_29770, partial [Lewinella sp.]|nr:hypothetical protein [Lewinella sp.]